MTFQKGNTFGRLRAGIKHTPETLLKMSESKKGRIPWMKGKKHSEESKKKISQSKKGQMPWNAGTGKGWINSNGYLEIRQGKNRFLVHQVSWMRANSFWYVPDGFVVHHIDRDKLNNHPDNLVLLPADVHTKVHWELEKIDGINRFQKEVI